MILLSVKEIGYQCGFQDTSYFVKTFRRHMLMTPSEYKTLSNIKDN
ncbi:MAG: helix-turn-helix domain-containing protein [Lachnospiraceae bacterium]